MTPPNPKEAEVVAMPNQFRKKPIVIEAFQFQQPTSVDEAPEWLTEAVVRGDFLVIDGVAHISTLEGVMTAQPGDWIIRGVKGELYPCKPDIFEATYEPGAVAQAAPQADGFHIEGLGYATQDDRDVLLEFKDEATARAFIEKYYPTVESSEMPHEEAAPQAAQQDEFIAAAERLMGRLDAFDYPDEQKALRAAISGSRRASLPDVAMPEPAAWLMLPSRTTWVDKAEAEQIMAACRHQTKLVPLYLAAQPAEGAEGSAQVAQAELPVPAGPNLYRKTALVRAEQFLPAEGKIPAGVISDGHGDPRKDARFSFVLQTLEGLHQLREGDYICTGAKGEKWNVERSIFESTYELAAEGATQAGQEKRVIEFALQLAEHENEDAAVSFLTAWNNEDVGYLRSNWPDFDGTTQGAQGDGK